MGILDDVKPAATAAAGTKAPSQARLQTRTGENAEVLATIGWFVNEGTAKETWVDIPGFIGIDNLLALPVNGSDEWQNFRIEQNTLIAVVQELGAELDEGEHTFINLKVRISRNRKKVSPVPSEDRLEEARARMASLRIER